jgi:hypothetical protein
MIIVFGTGHQTNTYANFSLPLIIEIGRKPIVQPANNVYIDNKSQIDFSFTD